MAAVKVLTVITVSSAGAYIRGMQIQIAKSNSKLPTLQPKAISSIWWGILFTLDFHYLHYTFHRRKTYTNHSCSIDLFYKSCVSLFMINKTE